MLHDGRSVIPWTSAHKPVSLKLQIVVAPSGGVLLFVTMTSPDTVSPTATGVGMDVEIPTIDDAFATAGKNAGSAHASRPSVSASTRRGWMVFP
jgi:hypothetical protein